jgi:hypothetical protein
MVSRVEARQIGRCVMRYSRHLVSLRTFGLAFAVVLTPALMQTDGLCDAGDTTLTVLEFEMEGVNVLEDDFNTLHRVYEVTMPEGVDSAVLRVESGDPDARVMANCSADCLPAFDHGNLPDGGGEVSLDVWPPGHSVLKVYIGAPEGAVDSYSIHVQRPAICE